MSPQGDRDRLRDEAAVSKEVRFRSNRYFSRCEKKLVSKLDFLKIFTETTFSCQSSTTTPSSTGGGGGRSGSTMASAVNAKHSGSAERLAPIITSSSGRNEFPKSTDEAELKRLLDNAVTYVVSVMGGLELASGLDKVNQAAQRGVEWVEGLLSKSKLLRDLYGLMRETFSRADEDDEGVMGDRKKRCVPLRLNPQWDGLKKCDDGFWSNADGGGLSGNMGGHAMSWGVVDEVSE